MAELNIFLKIKNILKMNCSELCPYTVPKLNCQIPSLTEEQIKNINLISNLSETLYIGEIFGHSVLILLTEEPICDFIDFYPYTPRVLGAWLCENSNYGFVVFENENYHYIQDSNILEYSMVLECISGLNHNSRISIDNPNKYNILIGNTRAVIINFHKKSKYKNRPTDIAKLNLLFPNIQDLPDWKRFYDEFYKNNSVYPKYKDILDRFDNDFSIEVDLLKSGYEIVKKLGEGSYGVVYQIKDKQGESGAVKLFPYYLDFEDIVIGDGDIVDINFSLLFKHPNIVETFDFIILDKNIGTIMEIADTTLKDLLLEKTITYSQKLKLIYQLSSAMDYLSSLGYIHCDLKPDNILIKNGNLLLADFTLIRIKENIYEDSCETENYRAPENYSISQNDFYVSRDGNKNGYFSPIDIKRWKNNQIASEMWSVGILCLDIIYNKPFLTFYGSDEIPSYDSSNEYYYLLENLCFNYQSRETASIIMDRYGQLRDEEYGLLSLICRCFLQLNQDLRVKSYSDFLNENIFKGIDKIYYPEVIYKTSKIITNIPEVYNSKMLNIATDWMFEVANEFELPLFVIFNSVDFFLQTANKYIKYRSEIQLFAVACLWIHSQIHTINYQNLEDYKNITSNSYNFDQIYDKVIEIIKGERGNFNYLYIYDCLFTSESLYKARDIMLNCETYARMGVRATADYIIKNNPGKTPKINVNVYKSLV